jgi:hypothetical protein
VKLEENSRLEGAAQFRTTRWTVILGVRAGAAKTLVHRFRKRYSAMVRQVARTVFDPAEVDEEIHALCETFIVSGERVGV